ncbi:IRK-interacting -like [Olea europaea subsp. europaea]|uniref:IRK-interacting -like n=1 Tax=Olea europaea subsp. europaea TaxID=158383 RepID=A0A8S0VDN5_OLEEU|nr:IRK-interacting -like [Olea europaea subsp. europaea]
MEPSLQISEMFQKFALAVKAKTHELFAEDDAAAADNRDSASAVDTDVISLLDSAEEIISDQKVVVIKPGRDYGPAPDARLTQTVILSLFATVSSFEASYLQFQTAHVPQIDQNALVQADKSLVSILQKLTEMKNIYKNFKKRSASLPREFEFPAGSFLEFQVQENQSKLRALETVVNSLQSEIDAKDDDVLVLRKKFDKIRGYNLNLSKHLGFKKEKMEASKDVLLTIRVFEAMLNDSVKSLQCFTKLLMDLMRRAGWDLEKAVNSVYSDIDYMKKGHLRYVFLSYVCLGMFKNFDMNDFGLGDSQVMCNGNGSVHGENSTIHDGYLRELIEHIASNPMEILSKNPRCEFSRFCEKKYEELIHPTMESSLFSNLDRKEKVLDSWKSLSVFYELFVRMASSIWLLHTLAYSFDPVVEIFQVERGIDFSMVYMEDVLGKCSFRGKTRPKVGFTVVPCFKVGRTVIQSQVYLTGLKGEE